MQFIASKAEETEALGQKIGRLMLPGDVITLSGDLGSGKTCFVRGAMRSLAPSDPDQASSPTYAILHEYSGKFPVYHFDLYRISGQDELFELGFNEYLNGTGACILEWPENGGEVIPPERLEIRFEHMGEDCRRITLIPHGTAAKTLLSQLDDDIKKTLSLHPSSVI